jgi:hypothetical protein
MAKTNFSNDAFRKGVMLGTSLSSARDGSSFRPWKTVLGNAMSSTTLLPKMSPKHKHQAKTLEHSMLSPSSSLSGHPAQTLPKEHRRANCHNSRKAVSTSTPLAGHMEPDNTLPRGDFCHYKIRHIRLRRKGGVGERFNDMEN